MAAEHLRGHGHPRGQALSSSDLEEAYERHRGRLYNYFRRCGMPRDASEDLTQSVFVIMLERAGDFDPARGSLVSFLFGVARNLRRAWERKSRRGLRQREPTLPRPEALPPVDEELSAVREVVGSLPDEQREALILREFHGFTYGEIAMAQEVAEGTVGSRLARARETVRRRIGEGE